MNVLMFGWEFPPNITGALGTACYGIVKGLSECQDVHVTFVIPKSQGNELLANNLQLISADQVNVGHETLRGSHWSNVSFLQVQSKLVPYLTPETFSEQVQELQSEAEFSENNPMGVKIINRLRPQWRGN